MVLTKVFCFLTIMMLFRLAPTSRLFSRGLRRFAGTSSADLTTWKFLPRDVEHEGRAWFLDLLRRYVPEIEVRAAPKKSHVSMFVRIRDEKSRYHPDVKWQSLKLQSSCQMALLQPTVTVGGKVRSVLDFPHSPVSTHTTGSGLILINPPGKLMWVLGPTRTQRIGISLNGKYSNCLVKPEEEPELFRQKLYGLLEAGNIPMRSWTDSLVDTAPSTRNLLHQLCSRPPFSTLEFDHDQWRVYAGILRGSKLIIRHFTQQRSYKYGSVRFCRTIHKAGTVHGPFHVSDDFDNLLILVPELAPGSALQKIGFLSKKELFDRGFLTTDTCRGRANICVKFDGDFSGTLLEGLEDNFIDVNVAPEELEAFVQRNVSSARSDGEAGMSVRTENLFAISTNTDGAP